MMVFRLCNVRVYRGLNVHCGFPAVAGQLEFVAAASAAGDSAALERNLARIDPDLTHRGASPAPAPRELPADPRRATALTVAWLTARLQNLAQGHVSDFAAGTDATDAVFALAGYQVSEVGRAAMALACDLIAASCDPQSPVPSLASLQQRVAAFVQSAQNWHLDLTTYSIVAAARERDIPHFRIGPASRFVQLGQGALQHHIFESESDRTSVTGSKLAHNKMAAHHLLASLGVPSPAQAAVSTFEEAVAAAAMLNYPLVVKPSHGMQGMGVTVSVDSETELAAAMQHATAAQRGGVLIEKFVPGDCHRLLVIDGTLVAAAQQIPAHVTGDGAHSVDELIDAVNQDPRRGIGFSRDLVRISRDRESERWLARQGCTYATVPAAGHRVFVRATANMSTGATAIDVTGQVHPDVRAMAELVALAFKLDVVGIDYLTTDISRSYRDIGGAVCEVNACPGLRALWAALPDRSRVLQAILALHFPDGANGRVPTVAITGSSGKTTTARMVASILAIAGKTVALASSDGAYVGACKVRDGDCAGGSAASNLLMDPRVEAAVVELGRGGLIRSGVPLDRCDVAAVLNVEFDHIGQDGIGSVDALAAVKLLVARIASRCVVLNAEDPRCVAMARHLHPKPVCWVAADAGHPLLAAHTSAGGSAVTVSGAGGQAELALLRGMEYRPIVSVREMPSSLNGTLHANVTNAMFAAAIGYSLGLPLDQLRDGLRAFSNDFAHNPGRYSFHPGSRCQVLVDRADSPHDMRALSSMVRSLSIAGSRVLAFTAPGNRSDAHIKGMAAAAAGSFERYICYSWSELRGRTADEVPSLLAAGLRTHGVAHDAIAVIPLQDHAIGAAIERAAASDLVTIVCLDSGARLEKVWRRIGGAC